MREKGRAKGYMPSTVDVGPPCALIVIFVVVIELQCGLIIINSCCAASIHFAVTIIVRPASPATRPTGMPKGVRQCGLVGLNLFSASFTSIYIITHIIYDYFGL